MINELIRDIVYIGTSAPVTPQLFTAPFDASHILLKNDSTVNFRAGLSTAVTTGSCILIAASEERFWQGLQSGCSVVALLTTSSSTGGFALRLGMWG